MYTGRRYYFITIAETLNITRASERLMVSQPSLTQYLNKLESDLEIKLVDRSFTPLRLTEAGHIYYKYLLEARRAEEELMRELRKLRARGSRPLMIGIPLQKSHELISRVLPRFAQEHPDTAISIWEGTSRTVRERVIKGELDIGFGHSMDEPCDGCIQHSLGREKLLLICSRSNPITGGRDSAPERTIYIPPELLQGQLFFQMSEEYYLYEVETRHMHEHGVMPGRVTIMSNLHAIIASVISCDDGFAYMPDYVMDELWPHSVMDKLSYFRLDEADLEWNFTMFRRQSSPLSPPARVFWKYVMDTFR